MRLQGGVTGQVGTVMSGGAHRVVRGGMELASGRPRSGGTWGRCCWERGRVGEAELSAGTASAPLRRGRRDSVGTGQEEPGPAHFPAHLLFLAFPFGAQLCPFVPRRCWCGHLAISVVFIPKFLVQTPMVTRVREPPRTCLRKMEKLLAHEAEKSRLRLSSDTSGSRNRSDFVENISLALSPFFLYF